MSPSAQQTHHEFVRLAAEEPSSLYFEGFLRSGYSAWPDGYQRRFPGLSLWPGIAGLKRRLNRLVGRPDSSHVLIASRSAQLMTLAARILSKTCRSIFTTDFSWPAYQNILQHEARRIGNHVHVAQCRRPVLRERMRPDELVTSIVQEYVDRNCDGLFLPAVDNLGIRLPIREIVVALRRQARLRFVAVDAAQALAHVPLDEYVSVADLTIAGAHKWLSGYFPLGVAFFGQPGTQEIINHAATGMVQTGELDDGLLRFCGQLTDANLDGYSETVNLGPLFSCYGAAADALATVGPASNATTIQSANAERIRDICQVGIWRPLMPETGFRTGILLLESCNVLTHLATGEAVRWFFQDRGALVTGYDGGIARLSMPKCRFSSLALRTLEKLLVDRGNWTAGRKLSSTGGPRAGMLTPHHGSQTNQCNKDDQAFLREAVQQCSQEKVQW